MIIIEQEAYENIIEPYIIASYSKSMVSLLRFLFVTPSLLQASPEVPNFLILPEVNNEENKEYSLVRELIQSRTKYRFEKIYINFIEFMSKIVREAIILVASGTKAGEKIDETEMTTKFVSLFKAKTEELKPELPHLVSEIIIPLSQSIRGGLSIALMDYILERWRKLNKFEAEYRQILMIMKKLSLIQPLLQVIICPHCTFTSLSISESITDIDYCPRCGRRPLIGTLFVLNENLSRLKQSREDIVYFIAAYLKYRSIERNPLLLPIIKSKHYVRGKREVDIYIKELNYGIECKVFDSVEVISRERIENWLNELKTKIDSYANVGIKYMLVVTNLKNNVVETLRTKLRSYINEKRYDMELEGILGADPEKLLSKLDDIADRLAEKISKKIKKEMEARIKTKNRK